MFQRGGALAPLLLLATPALGWDDVQTIDAIGTVTEGIDVQIPLGFTIDPIVRGPIWIGGVLKLTGEATPTVTLTADAKLSWGDDVQGTFRHDVTPIETALDLDSLAAYGLAIQIRDGNASGTVLLDLDLVGDEIPWAESLGVADGALLPGDDPEALVADEVGAAFPGVGFSLGTTVGVTLQQGLTSEIKATAEVRGVSFRTLVDGTLTTAGEPIDVANGTPGLDVKLGYEAEVDLDLAYEITKDPVLGIVLGPFTIPIKIPLKGTRLEAISGTLEVTAVGEARHGFGRLDDASVGTLPDVQTGTSADLVLTLDNGGEGPLEVAVGGITGSDAFTAPQGPWEIPSGDEVLEAVPFSPTEAGPQSATLTLTSSDPWNPEVTVALAATAVDPPSDEDELGDQTDGSRYDSCGCASAGGAMGGWLVLLPLLMVRRRR